MLVSTGFIKKLPLVKQYEKLISAEIYNVSLNAWFFMVNNESFVKNKKINIDIIEGGWCDFINENGYTENNVLRQVKLCREIGAKKLRLFFGVSEVPSSINNLESIIYSTSNRISMLCEKYPDINFYFENHGLLSNNSIFLNGVCKLITKNNFGLNFDFINFEIEGINASEEYKKLKNFIKMMHIKGRVGTIHAGYKDTESNFFDKHISKGLSKNIKYCIEYEGVGDPISDIKYAMNKIKSYGYE